MEHFCTFQPGTSNGCHHDYGMSRATMLIWNSSSESSSVVFTAVMGMGK